MKILPYPRAQTHTTCDLSQQRVRLSLCFEQRESSYRRRTAVIRRAHTHTHMNRCTKYIYTQQSSRDCARVCAYLHKYSVWTNKICNYSGAQQLGSALPFNFISRGNIFRRVINATQCTIYGGIVKDF